MPNWEKYNKWPKLCQTAINYTKWPYNIPNGHKIYQHLPFKGPPKFTQIGILVWKQTIWQPCGRRWSEGPSTISDGHLEFAGFVQLQK
jgi:hypothetical protein